MARNTVTVETATEINPQFRVLELGDIFSFPTATQLYMKIENRCAAPGAAVSLETGKVFEVSWDKAVKPVVPGSKVSIQR